MFFHSNNHFNRFFYSNGFQAGLQDAKDGKDSIVQVRYPKTAFNQGYVDGYCERYQQQNNGLMPF